MDGEEKGEMGRKVVCRRVTRCRWTVVGRVVGRAVVFIWAAAARKRRRSVYYASVFGCAMSDRVREVDGRRRSNWAVVLRIL